MSKQINKFDNDNKITILCKENYKVSSNNILNKIFSPLFFIYKIRKESKDFDAIISNLEGLPYLYLYIATIGLRLKKILWLHCEPYNYSKQLKYFDKLILNLSIFLSKNLICASPYAAEKYRNKKNTIFLPNFIDNKTFIDINEKQPLFLNNSLSLLFVGSLARLKRPWLVYDIALLLSNHFNNIEINFYGDGPLFDELLAYIKSKPNKKLTFYFHGYQKINWDLFSQNTILMQPSLTEAMPMIFLEAINAHIPVLSNIFPGSSFFDNYGLVFQSDFDNKDVTINLLLYITNLTNNEFNFRLKNSRILINKYFNNDLNIEKLKSFVNQ